MTERAKREFIGSFDVTDFPRETIELYYRRMDEVNNSLARHKDRSRYAQEVFNVLYEPGLEPFTLQLNESMSEEYAQFHYEGIYKLSYLRLFNLIGDIKFTRQGMLDWDKTFDVSS